MYIISQRKEQFLLTNKQNTQYFDTLEDLADYVQRKGQNNTKTKLCITKNQDIEVASDLAMITVISAWSTLYKGDYIQTNIAYKHPTDEWTNQIKNIYHQDDIIDLALELEHLLKEQLIPEQPLQLVITATYLPEDK